MQLLWSTEADTQAYCDRLAQRMLLNPGMRHGFISLQGALGAGKTTWVRHLLRALGVQGRIKSPTYALVEAYSVATEQGDWPVWHADFYRLEDPREVEEAGLRELFAGPGLKLAEWPEKALGQLPQPDLELTLSSAPDDKRRAVLRAHSPVGRAWLA